MYFAHLEENRKNEWDECVARNSSCGFMQSFAWSNFKRATGWETFKIGMFDDNDRLIGGSVVMKYHFSKTKNFLYIPEGPVLSYEKNDAEESFHKLMQEIDSIADLKGKSMTTHLRIEPRLTTVPDFFSRFRKSPFNMEPRDTILIDLSLSEEELLRQMKPKGRYNIKVAERHAVSVQQESSEQALKEFLELYADTTTRNSFDEKSPTYFEELYSFLKTSGLGKLFLARHNGLAIAGAIVIFFGDRASYFFGASSNQNREMMAPYLLHWEIMRAAKHSGCRLYDLWGVAPADADADHSWNGITEFKKKFGGTRINFIGAYDFVYNEKCYEEFLKESNET